MLDVDPVPGFPCSRWLAWSECEGPAVLLWPERAATAKVNPADTRSDRAVLLVSVCLADQPATSISLLLAAAEVRRASISYAPRKALLS